MTPTQKAQQLFLRYYDKIYYIYSGEYTSLCIKSTSKDCALIAVEEIKEVVRELCDEEILGIHMIYWEKVKQEIEKL